MLLSDGEPVSFGDLTTRLQVSRASISPSIRILEERALVRAIVTVDERQHFFILAPKPYETMLGDIRNRNRTTRAETACIIEDVPPEVPSATRLREYAQFYATVERPWPTQTTPPERMTPPRRRRTFPRMRKDD